MVDHLLTQFFKALRGAGVRVSTAEAIDGANTVKLFGYSDRVRLKNGLSMVLAKTEAEKHIYDLCFDQFFSFAAFDTKPSAQESEPASRDADQDDAGNKEASGVIELVEGDEKQGVQSSLGQMLLDNDHVTLQLEVAKAGDRTNVASIRAITQRGLFGRRIMEQMGLSAMENEMWTLEKSNNISERSTGHFLRESRDRLREEVKDYVAQQYLLQARESEKKLREDVMRSVKLDHLREFNDVLGIVRKIAKRLVTVHSRRKKVFRRGQLDVRSTIRNNVVNDGVLFNTHWKSRRVDRPKVIALCDVSGSVSTVARFLLMFLYSLQEIIPGVRAFVFASRAGEVTELFERMPVMEACAEAIDYYMGSTDYGSSLDDFKNLCINDIDAKTTVLILGDARNNEADPRTDLLKQISQRAKQVIWLNPEPKSRWNTGDSVMRHYTPYCKLAETCNSLNHLERLVGKLLA